MPIGMAVSGLFLFFLLTRRPYVRPTDDFLALLSESEVFLLLMSGNTFLNESGRDSWTDVTLSVVLIGVVFGFFGVFFYQVFDALIKFFRDRPLDSPLVAPRAMATLLRASSAGIPPLHRCHSSFLKALVSGAVCMFTRMVLSRLFICTSGLKRGGTIFLSSIESRRPTVLPWVALI